MIISLVELKSLLATVPKGSLLEFTESEVYVVEAKWFRKDRKINASHVFRLADAGITSADIAEKMAISHRMVNHLLRERQGIRDAFEQRKAKGDGRK